MYLGLASNSTFDQVMQSEHSFVERVYLIYKAVVSPELSGVQKELLESYGIKAGLLGGTVVDNCRGAAVAEEVDGVGA